MTWDLSGVWAKLEGMLHGLIVLPPNVGVAIIVFALLYVAGKGIKTLVMCSASTLGGLAEVQASRAADASAQNRKGGR
jgi:hypothetical protein